MPRPPRKQSVDAATHAPTSAGCAGARALSRVMDGAEITRHRLPAHGAVVVGRVTDADIDLLDGSVSRRHANWIWIRSKSRISGVPTATCVGQRPIAAGAPIEFAPEDVLIFGAVRTNRRSAYP